MAWNTDPTKLRAVDDTATLYEMASRDIWQCRVVTSDGTLIGHAVRQIVEPAACAIRYLIIYDSVRGLRLLLPAVFVAGAEPNTIVCSLAAKDVAYLPVYHETLTRAQETRVHERLGVQPYWDEEDPDPHSCDT